MRSKRIVLSLASLAGLWLAAASAPAQQATIGTPFRSVNSSFFEGINLNWGFNAGGVNFSFGAPNRAVPQFGGYNPAAGMSTGFALKQGPNSAFFNFSAAQGSQRNIESQTPSVTLMNGQTGYVSDTSQSPFVVSVIPVVGGFPSVYSLNPIMQGPMGMNPYVGASPLQQDERVQAMRRMIAERERGEIEDLPEPPTGIAPMVQRPAAPKAPARKRNDDDLEPVQAVPAAAVHGASDRLASAQASSAGRPAPSVAEARRMHEAEKGTHDREAMVLMERARTAEEDGKPGAAKIYYEMAARRATGELKQQALAKLAALRAESAPPAGSSDKP